MAKVKVSAVGQERREVEFEEGETLDAISTRQSAEGTPLPISTEGGVEVWVNYEQVDNPGQYTPKDDDVVVCVPNYKGALTR